MVGCAWIKAVSLNQEKQLAGSKEPEIYNQFFAIDAFRNKVELDCYEHALSL